MSVWPRSGTGTTPAIDRGPRPRPAVVCSSNHNNLDNNRSSPRGVESRAARHHYVQYNI
jgi:hypothetical protein